MAKFIELHNTIDGGMVIINTELITFFEERTVFDHRTKVANTVVKRQTVCIYFTDGAFVEVSDTLEYVKSKIPAGDISYECSKIL